jgi:hypothetical protein
MSAFSDISGHFGGTPGSEKTPQIMGFSHIF